MANEQENIKPGEWVRTSRFIADNDDWYAKAYSTCNGCVLGTNHEYSYTDEHGDHYKQVGRVGARVLDNCVGFANGAYNETFWKNKQLESTAAGNGDVAKRQYFAFTCNANSIIPNKVKNGYSSHAAISSGLVTKEEFQKCFIPPDGKPPVGGIVCWGGGANHVAYISGYDETTDQMTILQSGYDTPSWTTRDNTNGGWLCNETVLDRNLTYNGTLYKNVWWYNRSGYKFSPSKYCQGFVANPAVVTPPSARPSIETIEQPSATEVSIVGHRNSNSELITATKIYYRWDANVDLISFKGYDGIITTDKTDFRVSITKPRSAKFISVLPVNIHNDEMYEGDEASKSLYESYPCVHIVDASGNKVTAVPHIYTNGGWKVAVPTIRDEDDCWYEIYNTDKERVGG